MELKVFLFRLFLALFLGAVIGIERQIKQRSAGLVTNSLVSLGAAIYILVAIKTNNGHEDNLRVLGQIVTGIGFLGAGVIMRDGFTIHGLNTAATIWCSASIGSLAGFGLWLEAIIGASVIVLSHILFKPIVDYINNRPYPGRKTVKNLGYLIKIITQTSNENNVKHSSTEFLSELEGLQLRTIKSTYNETKEKVEIMLEILTYDPNQSLINKFISQISQLSFIEEVKIDTLREEIIQ